MVNKIYGSSGDGFSKQKTSAQLDSLIDAFPMGQMGPNSLLVGELRKEFSYKKKVPIA